MLQLKTLLTLEDAKVIVIDEGLNAPYGKHLVIGCLRQLQMQKEKSRSSRIEILSFSEPICRCTTESGAFYPKGAIVHDCYTIDLSSADNGESDIKKLETVINMIDRESTVVLDCLNSLILNVGSAKCFKLLKKIIERSSRLICIYRRHFITGDKVLLSVETLGTTYVKLFDCPPNTALCDFDEIRYTAMVTHRKAGGSILRQSKLLTQSIVSYDIIEETNNSQSDLKPESFSPGQNQKIETSFRIEMTDREMEQRQKTSLPYAISVNSNESKIHYRPEDIDDIDEEDPDDDLCI